MIVVDTSVLVDFFRGITTAASNRFARLENEATPFWLPTVCCQELIQGARDDREWRLLHDYLSVQRLIAPQDSWATHLGAARIFFDCRRSGITLRSSVDCLIAQLTLECDGLLLHDDEDFQRIREVRPLRDLQEY
jgi:predicted nucleic acid-binding protein